MIKIIGIALLFTLTGCSDWLDVHPRTEIQDEDVYSSETGFRNMLNGVYIRMANEKLYGENMSMYIPEYLAQHWSYVSTSTVGKLAGFQYEDQDVKPLFEEIWAKYYECISELNDILANMEPRKEMFSEAGYPLIKGEALGLRAFLHFELLRLFGPVPEDANPDEEAIAYVEELTKDPNKLLCQSYQVVVGKILRDFEAAGNCLASDPILQSLDNTVTGAKDEWLRYRQNRFNYYAVKGAMARFYHWIGQPDQAVKCAREVVEAKNSDESRKFQLATESWLTGKNADLVLSCEHLFGVHNPKHQEIVKPLYEGVFQTLKQTNAKMEKAYESSINPDDIRNKGQRYWEDTHFRKYITTESYQPANVVPVLRVAEMYLILIEDLPLEQAREYFKAFRIARNLSVTLDNSLVDELAVQQRLENEYRKEFFGEGQMFYFYKLHKTPQITWPDTKVIPLDAYRIPLPESLKAFQ